MENQSTDRTHRLGQTHAVQVYRYLISDSVEEKMELLKERKEKIFQSLLGSPQEIISNGMNSKTDNGNYLSQQDFQNLLKL